jgi:hypothetical protein
MTKRTLGALVAGVLVAGAALAAVRLDRPVGDTVDEETHHVETLAVTDLSDDRKLVGLAENVFVGTVVREHGATVGEPFPETQYDVKVVRAVKGSLRGEVVVSQQGGLDEDGVTVTVDHDAPLEPGRTYLFASRTNTTTGWHTLIPHYGTLTADAAGTRTDLVTRFETAERAQVTYSPTAPTD